MLVNDSVVALYVQLANRLSDAIYRGEYKSGDKLPSENSLCRQYGVSRITVRQALNLLVQQGLAFSVHGKGTFVKTPDISHELNRIVSFSRVLQLKGLTGHTRVKGFQTDVVDAQANKKIGGPLSMLELVGYAAQTPVVYYRSYFPPALGEKMWEAARQAEAAGIAFSTYDLYARIGIRLEGVEQTLAAVNADSELEQLLELPRGKALLVLRSLYSAHDGQPLEYKCGYYRSDIYSFHLQRQI